LLLLITDFLEEGQANDCLRSDSCSSAVRSPE